MGLNILVTKLSSLRDSHPDWDDMKYGGDRQAALLMHSLPIETVDLSTGYPDVEPYYRPTDFAAWRDAPWPEENSDRWQHLINILEADPSYWIYLSY
ncbi:hypothetical protein [Sphingobium sp. LSP13-1-1.1]|uniref:hypothetical protein n=1 Tax=Sphingobium sp. LSP13-1-1.1 TaxID=3135234 RepID=UPI00341DF5BF